MGVNRHACVMLWLAISACAACRPAAAETPSETVRQFLGAMDRSAADSHQLREAYTLLDGSAQGALRERAHKTGTLTGRDYEPWEMLAQGRFRLRFRPAARRGMQERIAGAHAVVTVLGEAGEKAEVPLVQEHGRWRIRLPVPALVGGDAQSP
jgi:hypothetical protein